MFYGAAGPEAAASLASIMIRLWMGRYRPKARW